VDLTEIGRDGVDWSYCVQNRQWWGWVGAVMNTVLRKDTV